MTFASTTLCVGLGPYQLYSTVKVPFPSTMKIAWDCFGDGIPVGESSPKYLRTHYHDSPIQGPLRPPIGRVPAD